MRKQSRQSSPASERCGPALGPNAGRHFLERLARAYFSYVGCSMMFVLKPGKARRLAFANSGGEGYAATLLFVPPIRKVQARVKSSGGPLTKTLRAARPAQLARADKHGEPAQPQEPEDAQGALPLAVGLPKNERVYTCTVLHGRRLCAADEQQGQEERARRSRRSSTSTACTCARAPAAAAAGVPRGRLRGVAAQKRRA